MQKKNYNAQDLLGNAIPNAAASVYLKGTSTLATIYSDNGITPATNPLTTDANGMFSFYVADGRYDIQAVKAGYTTQNWKDELFFDPNASTGSAYVSFVQSGTATRSRALSGIIDETVRITNYTGGVADGTDNTAAVTNAVADVQGTGRVIYFPRSANPYLVSAWPQVNTGGYTIKGDGWDRKEAVIAASPNGVSRTTNVVTVTTTVAHGFSTGQTVVVANTVPVGATNFNGTFTIASTPTATTFTYAQTAANDTGGAGACSVMVGGSIIKITGGGIGIPYGYGTGKVQNFSIEDIAFMGVSRTDGSYGLTTNGAQTARKFRFSNVAFFNFQYGVNPKSLSHTDFYGLDVSFCGTPVLIGNGAYNVNFYGSRGNWAADFGVTDQVGGGYAINFFGGEFDDAVTSDIKIIYSTGVWFYGTDLENVNVIPSVASVELAGGSYNGCTNCTIGENFNTKPAAIISGGTQNMLVGGAATGAGGLSISAGSTHARIDNVYHNGTLTDNGIGSRITDFANGETLPGILAVAGAIQAKQVPSTAWSVDFTAVPVTTITASGTYDLASGSGLVVIHDNTTGDAAAFLVYGGTVTKLGGAATIVSGAPGASQTGFFYNVGTVKYRIQNGYALSHDYYIAPIRTRPSS